MYYVLTPLNCAERMPGRFLAGGGERSEMRGASRYLSAAGANGEVEEDRPSHRRDRQVWGEETVSF